MTPAQARGPTDARGDQRLLEISGVTRVFSGLTALKAVTTHVAANELVGLIGPNGAGKTTLFNLISGFIAPTEGEIRFDGRSLSGMKPHRIARLGIGRTFQNLRILPNMTVFDNVSIGALAAFGQTPWQALAGGGWTTINVADGMTGWAVAGRPMVSETGSRSRAPWRHGRSFSSSTSRRPA